MNRIKRGMLLLIFALIGCFNIFSCSKKGKKLINTDIVYSEEKISPKKRQEVIGLLFEMGFNEHSDIRIFLNDKLISICKKCTTNESIGFVMEEKSSKIYEFLLKSLDIRIGDVLKIEYAGEMAVYYVSEDFFYYQAIYICRNFCKGKSDWWSFSFEPYRKDNIE